MKIIQMLLAQVFLDFRKEFYGSNSNTFHNFFGLISEPELIYKAILVSK